MRRSFLTATSFLVLFALPLRGQEGAEYFPVNNFRTWTYRINGQEDRLVVTAFQVTEPIGGFRCYRYEGRMRNQIIVTEHLSVRKEGVYRVRHDNIDIDPPLLICKFPPTKGQTWKSEYKIGEKKVAVTFTTDMEEIPVPKSKTNETKANALVIRAEIVNGEHSIKSTCWYAPNRGLVKQVLEEDDGQITLELEPNPPKGKPMSP